MVLGLAQGLRTLGAGAARIFLHLGRQLPLVLVVVVALLFLLMMTLGGAAAVTLVPEPPLLSPNSDRGEVEIQFWSPGRKGRRLARLTRGDSDAQSKLGVQFWRAADFDGPFFSFPLFATLSTSFKREGMRKGRRGQRTGKRR